MKVPDYVQRMIAGTNGRMWIPLIGKLNSLPIPSIPIPPAPAEGGLFLDIGAGWGRWLVAAARKGYTSVGIDIKYESAEGTREVLRLANRTGYVLVADLAALPFAEDLFDVVWSFSVIQHVHRDKADRCLDGIARCLKPGGLTVLEYPTQTGLWNRFVQARRPDAHEEDDPEAWCVRYYTLSDLRDRFVRRFGQFSYKAHCYFGIGILPTDLGWVPWRYRPVVLGSLLTAALANTLLPPLARAADSVYCSARKPGLWVGGLPPLSAPPGADPNLALLPYLRCPKTRGALVWDADRKRLLSRTAGIAYPVRNGIPILLPEHAEPLS
jgi:SAM-dependent methyltransferase/uncharacterized protein YbaR (Trm112 family)